MHLFDIKKDLEGELDPSSSPSKQGAQIPSARESKKDFILHNFSASQRVYRPIQQDLFPRGRAAKMHKLATSLFSFRRERSVCRLVTLILSILLRVISFLFFLLSLSLSLFCFCGSFTIFSFRDIDVQGPFLPLE